jgi:Ca-activated chloride channel family protein
MIVLDRSQSMLANQKMQFAKLGAIEAVKSLGDEDRLSFLLFNQRIDPLVEEDDVKAVRPRLLAAIPNIVAQGQTSLYDALQRALDDLEKARREDLITAIVLLSDGLDTNSQNSKLQGILDRLQAKTERSKVRVFTIYYGQDANKAEMEMIAKAGGGLAFEGKPENIVKVFKDEIFPFFAPH